jgi:hypothetical protein
MQIQHENQPFLYREAIRITLSFGRITCRTTLLVASVITVNLALAQQLSTREGPDDNRILL